MNYVLCSVLWTDSDSPPSFAASAVFAALVSDGNDGNAPPTVYKSFLSENYGSVQAMLDDFLDFCQGEFMLCLWDGSSAGRMKKLFDANGRRHPYVHMYHLKKVSELSLEKCSDPRDKKALETKLRNKPAYHGKRASAETEVKWLVSLFPLLDFSVMEKKPAVDFIEQPSNVYFVFRNGKCFHTNKCRIVRDAALSSLRSYTYYSTVTEAGFTPCSKCKPEDLDEKTSELMKKINAEKQREAAERYASGETVKPKKKRRKPLDMYKSLSHMCDIYGLSFDKKGKNVYITAGKRAYMMAPDENPVRLSLKNRKGEFAPVKKTFPDPYEAVREITRAVKKKSKPK